EKLHGIVDAGDDSGLEEAGAEVGTSAASTEDFRAAMSGVFKQIAHALDVLRTDERTDVGGRITAGTQARPLRFLDAELREAIGDGLLDEEALDGKTNLAAIGVAAPNGRARSDFEIGVG